MGALGQRRLQIGERARDFRLHRAASRLVWIARILERHLATGVDWERVGDEQGVAVHQPRARRWRRNHDDIVSANAWRLWQTVNLVGVLSYLSADHHKCCGRVARQAVLAQRSERRKRHGGRDEVPFLDDLALSPD